jgi:hypothetical protein
MKLSEIKLNGEYAIVPSWTYNNQSARDVDRVRENDVVKATVISLDKYEYEPSIKKQSASDFVKAQAGNRSVGILVKATDSNGTDYYWTSRLADVVAEWSVLEPKWRAKQSAEQEEDRKRKEQAIKEQEIRRKVEEEVARSTTSVITSAKDLLGAGAVVDVNANGYGVDYKAVVSISLAEFERLLELAYEGKAVVA